MHLRQIIAGIVLTLVMVINPRTPLVAQPQSDPDAKPFIGILIDPQPPSDLFRKHLGLEPGQGLTIGNVMAGSPADQAGLEKDDIVLSFEGQMVSDYDRFVRAIHDHRINDVVKMEVLHLGKKRRIEIRLAPRGDGEWKYGDPQAQVAPIPQLPQGMVPFGDPDRWREFYRLMPPGRQGPSRQHFELRQHYHYRIKTDDGQDLEVTIEGDPGDPQTPVKIETQAQTIDTTVQDMDQIPEKLQAPVKQLLDQAQTDDDFSKPGGSFPWDQLDPRQLPSMPWHHDQWDGRPWPDLDRCDDFDKRLRELERLLRNRHSFPDELDDPIEPADPTIQEKDSEKIKL